MIFPIDITDNKHKYIKRKYKQNQACTQNTDKKLEIGLEDIKTDSILHRSLQKLAFIELAPSQRNREEKKHTNIKKNLRVNKHVCFEPKWGIVVREN